MTAPAGGGLLSKLSELVRPRGGAALSVAAAAPLPSSPATEADATTTASAVVPALVPTPTPTGSTARATSLSMTLLTHLVGARRGSALGRAVTELGGGLRPLNSMMSLVYLLSHPPASEAGDEDATGGQEPPAALPPDAAHWARAAVAVYSRSEHKMLRALGTGFERSDVLHAQLVTGDLLPAHALLRDRQQRALLLVVRGTASLDDLITDLTGSVVDAVTGAHVDAGGGGGGSGADGAAAAAAAAPELHHHDIRHGDVFVFGAHAGMAACADSFTTRAYSDAVAPRMLSERAIARLNGHAAPSSGGGDGSGGGGAHKRRYARGHGRGGFRWRHRRSSAGGEEGALGSAATAAATVAATSAACEPTSNAAPSSEGGAAPAAPTPAPAPAPAASSSAPGTALAPEAAALLAHAYSHGLTGIGALLFVLKVLVPSLASWPVVIVGHSLGAAVAALLTARLRIAMAHLYEDDDDHDGEGEDDVVTEKKEGAAAAAGGDGGKPASAEGGAAPPPPPSGEADDTAMASVTAAEAQPALPATVEPVAPAGPRRRPRLQQHPLAVLATSRAPVFAFVFASPACVTPETAALLCLPRASLDALLAASSAPPPSQHQQSVHELRGRASSVGSTGSTSSLIFVPDEGGFAGRAPVTTVVIGDDFVPRLTIASVRALHDRLADPALVAAAAAAGKSSVKALVGGAATAVTAGVENVRRLLGSSPVIDAIGSSAAVASLSQGVAAVAAKAGPAAAAASALLRRWTPASRGGGAAAPAPAPAPAAAAAATEATDSGSAALVVCGSPPPTTPEGSANSGSSGGGLDAAAAAAAQVASLLTAGFSDFSGLRDANATSTATTDGVDVDALAATYAAVAAAAAAAEAEEPTASAPLPLNAPTGALSGTDDVRAARPPQLAAGGGHALDSDGDDDDDDDGGGEPGEQLTSPLSRLSAAASSGALSSLHTAFRERGGSTFTHPLASNASASAGSSGAAVGLPSAARTHASASPHFRTALGPGEAFPVAAPATSSQHNRSSSSGHSNGGDGPLPFASDAAAAAVPTVESTASSAAPESPAGGDAIGDDAPLSPGDALAALMLHYARTACDPSQALLVPGTIYHITRSSAGAASGTAAPAPPPRRASGVPPLAPLPAPTAAAAGAGRLNLSPRLAVVAERNAAVGDGAAGGGVSTPRTAAAVHRVLAETMASAEAADVFAPDASALQLHLSSAGENGNDAGAAVAPFAVVEEDDDADATSSGGLDSAVSSAGEGDAVVTTGSRIGGARRPSSLRNVVTTVSGDADVEGGLLPAEQPPQGSAAATATSGPTAGHHRHHHHGTWRSVGGFPAAAAAGAATTGPATAALVASVERAALAGGFAVHAVRPSRFAGIRVTRSMYDDHEKRDYLSVVTTIVALQERGGGGRTAGPTA